MRRPNRPLPTAATLLALGALVSLTGCVSTGGGGLLGKLTGGPACDAAGCDVGCGPCVAGGPNCDNACGDSKGPKRWSDEWYALNTGKPIGVGQVHKFGQAWPPYARPCETPQFSEMFHAAHYWPYPYVGQDRDSVRQYFVVQQQNGWVNATTMYEYLFDAETNELTTAGRGHVAWMLFNAAIHPEAIFVQKTYDTSADSARLANVQAAATELLGGATPPAIVLRHAKAVGRPAEEVDLIRRNELESYRQPVLSTYNDDSDASGGEL